MIGATRPLLIEVGRPGARTPRPRRKSRRRAPSARSRARRDSGALADARRLTGRQNIRAIRAAGARPPGQREGASDGRGCPPVCEFDWPAPISAAGHRCQDLTRATSFWAERPFLVMFICKPLPLRPRRDRKIVRDAADLQASAVGVAAICSTDARLYPQGQLRQDARDGRREERFFQFPYLHDAGPERAGRPPSALSCNPRFSRYSIAAISGLQYRGPARTASAPRTGLGRRTRGELYEAMKAVRRRTGGAGNPPSRSPHGLFESSGKGPERALGGARRQCCRPYCELALPNR